MLFLLIYCTMTLILEVQTVSSTEVLSVQEVQSLFPSLQVVQYVGKGASKVVYEVVDNNERFALKLLSADIDFMRLIREIRAMQTIQSPHVAKLNKFKAEASVD